MRKGGLDMRRRMDKVELSMVEVLHHTTKPYDSKGRVTVMARVIARASLVAMMPC